MELADHLRVLLLQIPKPALLKGVGMSPGAGPVAGGNGYSRGGSVEFEGPSGYASGGGGGMPEGGASQYMGGEPWPFNMLWHMRHPPPWIMEQLQIRVC